MKRRSGFRDSLVVFLFLAIASRSTTVGAAGDSVATRPYFSLFAASIDRLVEACEVVFASVDRSDLFKSLDERLKTYRNFAGIERSKPLGLMSIWNDVGSADIVFLPVKDIDQLLKTATFEIVGYHPVGPNRFEIERPGAPYQVLVRNEYAFLADDLSTIQALRVTPEQLTRGLRDRFDVVLHLDPRQLPLSAKTRLIEGLKDQVEPWLQPLDKEASESVALRKAIGKLFLDLLQRTVLDTSTAIVGVHLDPKTRQFSSEIVLEATPGSVMATGLNRWIAQRSAFAPLVSPDVPAGVAINLPLSGLVEQILAPSSKTPSKGTRLEGGLQLVGSGLGNLTLIAALGGTDAVQLNDAIPGLIVKLEKSGQFLEVNENFDLYHGAVLHSLIPRELPSAITHLVGPDPEIVIGQGKKVVWMGIGRSETLLDRLRAAIDLIDESSSDRAAAPLVRARFQAKQLPELVASDLLIRNVDGDSSRAAFAAGQDGFLLTIEPTENGIKIRFEAEEGFVRLIGRDWVKQIENAK